MTSPIEIIADSGTLKITILENGVATVWIECINIIHFNTVLLIFKKSEFEFMTTDHLKIINLGRKHIYEHN